MSRWKRGHERKNERFPNGTLAQSQSILFHILPFEIRDLIWRFALCSEHRLYLNPTIRTVKDMSDDPDESLYQPDVTRDGLVHSKVDYFAAARSRNGLTVCPSLLRTCRRV